MGRHSTHALAQAGAQKIICVDVEADRAQEIADDLRSALAQIARLLPGSESPTVLPLDGMGDKVAVHAVCRETVFWETLESLKAAGASAVLVLPVEKMLP